MSLSPEQRTPPQSASNNAQRGLDLRKKWNRGGLSPSEAREQGIDSGVTRARQLVNGGALSEETIKKMARFNRHRKNYKPDKKEPDGGPTAGTIAWLLWGGTSGIDWALSRVSMMDKKGESLMENRITVPFQVKESGIENDGFFHIKGLASTWDVDLGNDEITPGAFIATIEKANQEAIQIEGTDFKALIPSLWQHNIKEPTGSFVEMKETEHGLWVHSIHPLEDDFVRGRLKPQVKVGSVRKMSIGYHAKKFTFRESENKRIRVLEEIDLGEISLVTFPMNPGANIMDAKGATTYQDFPLAEDSTVWNSIEAVNRVRQFTDSTEEPSEDYKKAFLWFDSQNDEAYGAYKLPFADVIIGELKAVPKAIFAAAAALQGARGGVDIPETDRDQVERHINRYYEKMGRESPLNDKCLIVDAIDAKNLTVTEFERIMKSCQVTFNNEAIKIMISNIKNSIRRDADEKDLRDAETDIIDQKLDKLMNLMEIK